MIDVSAHSHAIAMPSLLDMVVSKKRTVVMKYARDLMKSCIPTVHGRPKGYIIVLHIILGKHHLLFLDL